MILIDGNSLRIEEVVAVARLGEKVQIDEKGKMNLKKSRQMVDRLVNQGKVVYGITTGFGKFSTVNIDSTQTEKLQENLIITHAVGVGEGLSEEVVRATMLLRANALAKGYSGIRVEVVQTLIDMLNKGVHPVIPEKGSLGASGDLAPLAHMVLVMIGRGEAKYKGKVLPGDIAMKEAGIPVITLKSKEGLAMINGTPVMTAIGTLALYDCILLAKIADISAAMTCEALEAIPAAFDPKVQEVRPHEGQKVVAQNMLNLLQESKVFEADHGRVQDAYALRCIPQVHGATRDAINYVKNIITIEINSVTDNPILFPEQDEVISGGNFHGQPVAQAMDFLKIAISELANISERRIERLVNPALSCGLKGFLTKNGGLNSGFMICQYVAASLVSENKVLSHPASVDSIPSSANQEDHVSMGTIAARKLREIVDNVKEVLAIELTCAAQGMDLRGNKPGVATKAAYDVIRGKIERLEDDRELRLDIKKARGIIDSEEMIIKMREVCPKLI